MARRISDVAEGKKISRALPSETADQHPEDTTPNPPPAANGSRVKFEIFGEEMIEKRVKASGNSGRVYLPPDWVGHKVKIIRID
jgi:putative transposon-encoded protein